MDYYIFYFSSAPTESGKLASYFKPPCYKATNQKKKDKNHSTQDSRVVPHRGTN